MMKSTGFAAGAILVAIIMALLIFRERCEIGRLRSLVALLQAERNQFAVSVEENRRASNSVEQTVDQAPATKEPSIEVLRLRGQVAQLRSELEDLRQKKQDEIFEPALLDPADSLFLSYSISGIDTNSLPKIVMGATTNDVLTELQKVGARLLTEQEKYVGPDKYIQAEVSPALVTSNSAEFVTIRMEFYFDDGRLSSRRDWPMWHKTSNQ